MFDHVTIRASDREASERFYDLVLRTLGVDKAHSDEDFAEWNDFSLGAANGEQPVTHPASVPTRQNSSTSARAGAPNATCRLRVNHNRG